MDGTQTFQWSALAKQTKAYIIAAAVLLVIIIGSLIWDDVQQWYVNHELEQTAAQAARDKDKALTQAANVASQLREKEKEQSNTEAKRDVKAGEVKSARDDVDRDRVDYSRAQRSHRSQTPSTDELCNELANAGHPCQPQ